MYTRTLASLGCKFLAIYALIQAVPLLGQIFQIYSFTKNDPSFGISVVFSTSIPFILMLAVAVILFLYSYRIADKMIGTKDDESTHFSISAIEFQTVAFSIVGLVLLLLSFPKILQIIWNAYAIKSAGDERSTAELIMNTWSFALATGLQFVIGFVLFIGAELLATLWYKAIKRLRYERNIT